MNHSKKHSFGIRWKLFAFMLIPTFLLLIILWLIQTVFFGLFYARIKTDELKRTTSTVIRDIEKSDIKDTIMFLAGNGDINISVIDTKAFENLYSSGEAFDSVTYGWGAYGMFKLYDEVMENGGEYVRYYSAKNQSETEKSLPNAPQDFDRDASYDERDKDVYRRIPTPGVFGHIGHKNQLLYAKTARLSDDTEIMVVADTRISPFDSTVSTLRYQLIISSIISVFVSLLLSYFISRKVSKPIENINKSAKTLATGNFDVHFEGKGYREIEQLSDTLNFTSRELGKADSLRKELMANVSHDMRTPLTMIVGYSEVMRDIPGENTPENVQVIIDEANRLSAFVNSVLDLTKLQSGMDKLETQTLDITELVWKTAERYTKLLAENECEVVVHGMREQVYVNGDITKLTQVLHNLADNAVNYSKEPKKIVITQKLTNDGYVRVEIKDNGEGINPDELPYIWDRYYKTKNNHKRNLLGSGLGLSIVKEILEKHYARYGVETSQNNGSTFWFELRVMGCEKL